MLLGTRHVAAATAGHRGGQWEAQSGQGKVPRQAHVAVTRAGLHLQTILPLKTLLFRDRKQDWDLHCFSPHLTPNRG